MRRGPPRPPQPSLLGLARASKCTERLRSRPRGSSRLRPACVLLASGRVATAALPSCAGLFWVGGLRNRGRSGKLVARCVLARAWRGRREEAVQRTGRSGDGQADAWPRRGAGHVLVVGREVGCRLDTLRAALRALGQTQPQVSVCTPEQLAPQLEDAVFDLVVVLAREAAQACASWVAQVKQHDAECPVLLLAEPGDEAVVVDAVREGLDAFVAPSGDDVPSLVAAIRQALERASSLRRASWVEMRLRALLEQLRVGVFRARFDGVVIEANQGFARILGLPSQQAAVGYALHASGFDAEVVERLQSELHRRGQVRLAEIPLLRPDGERIWVSVTESLGLGSAGEPLIDGLLEDVTERKRAEDELRRRERYYRSLIDNALDLVVVLDCAGVVRFASASVERLLGCSPQQATGARVVDAVAPEDRGRFERQLDAWCAGDEGEPGAPIRLRHADGSWRWFELRGNRLPETDDAGLSGVVVHGRDVTEQLRAQRELEESEKRLRQAQKMEAVGRLAGGVAHDFNNVITSVLGHCDLVLERLHEGDPLRDDVEEIVRAAERAAGLTRQLLAFSREQVVRPTVLRVGAVVGELERMLRRLIGEDLELVTRRNGGEPSIEIDRGQLEQVILNLVVNARDAMPSGGRLTIATDGTVLEPEAAKRVGLEPERRYARLVVEDTGCGMDDDTLTHIFEPFFTTKEQGKGTGLGLATVYGVVVQAGGSIDVRTAPGHGTRFTLYFPAVEAEREALPVGEPSRGEAAVTGGGETLLLVEDDDLVRMLVLRLLRRGGYEVLEASNAGEALLICEQHRGPIHLLLTDVVMPRMSGPELAGRLARLRPELRVLFMSGYPASESSGMPRQGSFEYLAKPFTPEALYRRLREVLERPAGRVGQR
ncbi:MAG: PAS domain S-box protein [Planctomycetota bacterium]|nr:MAG: PAS domain S-box protein [Planctomycetota bacterium]